MQIPAVGAGQVHFGEVGQDIYDQGVVYVDSMVSARIELKDLKARIVGEVGEVIRSGKRTENERITIYQSMGEVFNNLEIPNFIKFAFLFEGIAAEDATVAQAIYDAKFKENHCSSNFKKS